MSNDVEKIYPVNLLEEIHELDLTNAYALAVISKYAYKTKDVNAITCLNLFSEDTCGCYEFVSGNDELLIIWDNQFVVVAFAGTNDIRDVKTDIDVEKVNGPFESEVHDGFNGAVNTFGYKIIELLSTEFKKHKIFICGHSLGGAMAALFTAYIYSNDCNLKDRHVATYTYGSPRFSSYSFKPLFNEQIGNYFRFVNNNDAVTLIPLVGWKHVGNFVYINSGCDVITDDRKKSFIYRLKDKFYGRFKDNPAVDTALSNGIDDHFIDNYIAAILRNIIKDVVCVNT